jgi:hypothetical protein
MQIGTRTLEKVLRRKIKNQTRVDMGFQKSAQLETKWKAGLRKGTSNFQSISPNRKEN